MHCGWWQYSVGVSGHTRPPPPPPRGERTAPRHGLFQTLVCLRYTAPALYHVDLLLYCTLRQHRPRDCCIVHCPSTGSWTAALYTSPTPTQGLLHCTLPQQWIMDCCIVHCPSTGSWTAALYTSPTPTQGLLYCTLPQH